MGAAVAALLVQRFRLVGIPVYLLTGAALGPHATGVLGEPGDLGGLSHLALVLLLFGVGLDLHLDALRLRWARTLGLGLTSIALCITLAYPAARAFGLESTAAWAVAMACSLSSTAVVLRVLAQRRQLRDLRGRLSLSVLVIQDLAVLAMLAVLPALAPGAGDAAGWAPSWSDAGGLLGVGALILIGRTILPRLLQRAFESRSLEVGMLVGIAAALSFADVTHRLGFSLEMGGFVAGFALAGTPFRHQLSSQIAPLRDLFLAIFFTTLGAEVDPAIVVQHLDVVLLGTVALVLIKTVATGSASMVWGTTAAVATGVGLGLAQAGEFSLVLLRSARDLEILDGQTTSILVSITVLTLLATPVLLIGAEKARGRIPAWTLPWAPHRWNAGRRRRRRTEPQKRAVVVVVGYGPVGQAVTEHLEAWGHPCSVVDLNPHTIRDQARAGRRMVFGDAGQLEVLVRAGIEEAAGVVLTIPDADSAARACQAIRRLRPGMPIVARAATTTHAQQVEAAGPSAVVVDELATAEALRAVLDRELAAPAEEASPADDDQSRITPSTTDTER